MWGYAASALSVGTATRFAIAIGGVHLVFGQLMGAYRVTLRSHHHFGIIARATLVEAALLLALVVAGAQLLDAPGTMAGWALGLAIVCLYFLSFRLVPGTPRLDFPATVSLIKVGLPVLGVGLAESWMRTADTVIIAKLLGAQALGYYGVAWQLSAYLYNVPASAGFVIMPKILRAHGEGGPEATRRSVLEMTKALSILTPALTGLAAIAGPAMVRLVLQQYLPAIPPLEILLMATVFLALPVALRTMLIAQNRERELMAWQVLSGCLTAGAVAWLIGREAPLAQLAIGTGIGWFVGGVAVVIRSLQALGLGLGSALRQTAAYFVPFVYCSGLLWGLKVLAARWTDAPSQLVCDVICLAAFGALTSPLLWYAERTTGIITKLRSRGAGPSEPPTEAGGDLPMGEGGGEA
jgi:O-antigen/teichoic acid export membrane protein